MGESILDITLRKDNLNENKIEIQKQIQQEYKFIGTVSKNKGHLIFEYNKETKRLKLASIQLNKTVKIETEGTIAPMSKYQIMVGKNCLYFQALNLKNAMKKVRKYGFEIIE